MTTKIGSGVYAGRYIDDKPGAILLSGDQLAHLGPDQCAVLALVLLADLDAAQRRQLARVLTDAAQTKETTDA